jgi:membrane fusion protein, adhesin transport system
VHKPLRDPVSAARSRQATIIIVLTAVAVVGFILWSLWANLDQITRARGQVIPTGRVQIIQSSEGGVISRILVREGDKVEKGQLLVTLDKVKLRAAVDESSGKVAALKTAMARIQAELFDRPLSFPADVSGYPDFVNNQRMLYLKRRQALSAELSSLRSMLSLVREELAMNRPLVDSGDVSRSEILRMQRTVSDLEGQIVNRQNEYLQELQTEYAKTEEELVTAEQQLTQRQDALEQTELTAPTDGIVKNIRLTTVGGVLRAGDEVLQIVPTGDELIVEAKVSPADIAFIRVGQDANVKFDAYDASIYGSGDGEVSYISPDTLSEKTEEGEQTYYRVHLTADTSTLRPRNPGERIEIQPGMTATVEIKTGETTVFRYLTKPIVKTTSESLGER